MTSAWRIRTAAMVVLAVGMAGGQTAAAHEPAAGTRHLSEAQVRLQEEKALGPEHAAEHAALRRLARQAQARQARHRQWLRSLTPAQRRLQLAHERTAAAREKRADRRLAQALPAAAYGAWTTGPTNIPVMGINAATLPTGKVLFWAYPTNPNPIYNPSCPTISSCPNNSLSAVWDPATNQTKVIPPPVNPSTGERTNIWCSGISFLADGRVLATGGNLGYTPDWRGLQRVYIFDPWAETWTEQGQMRHGRWYPSQALLPDGRTLIMQGYDESGTQTYNRDIEVFDTATGKVSLVGQLGSAGAPPVGGYYPHLFVMPSGRLLVAGPDRGDSWLFNAPGRDLSFTSIAHPSPQFSDRLWGNAVLLPGGPDAAPTRVMQLGGSKFQSDRSDPYAMPTTEVFDEANPGAGWQYSSNLNVARSHSNTVLLPDGTMVQVGGGLGTTKGPAQANQYLTAPGAPERQVELYDPATKAWRLGPAQAETRAYHSTAALLPDGRVVSAGDDFDGPGGPGTGLSSDTVEIYSPPYLFKGARPTIRQAPTSVQWNTAFGVGTPDGNVTQAVLMAPSATTHATDMNQRAIFLRLAKRADGLGVDLTSPANANIAPPGMYMLFLLNDRGVPSVASWIKLDPAAPAPPPLIPPPAQPQPRPGLTLSVRAPKRVAYRDFAKKGFTVRVRCSAACRPAATLSAGKKTARKLRLKGRSRIMGRSSRMRSLKTAFTVRVKPRSTVAKTVRNKRAPATVRLTISARGADGTRASVRRSVRLTRSRP